MQKKVILSYQDFHTSEKATKENKHAKKLGLIVI